MLRSRIARRYWAVLAGVIGAAALVFGLVQGVLVYREARLDASRLQASELAGVAARVESGLQAVVGSLRLVCALPWSSSLLTPADQRAELQRLVQRHPAVVEAQGISAGGLETAFVSRLTLDRFASGKPATPFLDPPQGRSVFGPMFFRDSLAPHVKVACREAGIARGAVIVVEMNLEFVSEVVAESARRLRGDAFLVDDQGRLIAHSRPVAVFSAGDATTLGVARLGPSRFAEPSSQWTGPLLSGSLVSSIGISHAPWRLAVSQPSTVVLARAVDSVTATIAVALLLAGLSALAALWLAARLTRPIRDMTRAVGAISRGQLDHRLEVGTGDELEALAREFNAMAEQIREYTTGLERKVDERTTELRGAIRARALFLAAASHDLRQPLYAISILADTIALESLPQGARATLAKQREAIAVLRGLFDNLLDLSRFDSGEIRVNPRTVALREILTPIAIEHEVVCRAKGLEWKCDIADAWVVADPELVRRIAANLLSNAVRYTPRGSVSLVAEPVGAHVRLVVSDTGIGIAPEDQQRVFEEFVQLENPSRDRERGVGLGLSIVKKISGLLGANLQMKSTPGEGTRISIDIPLAQELPAPLAGEPQAGASTAEFAGLRIWAVEDDPLVRSALGAQFDAWGVDYAFAASRADVEALRESDGGWPDGVMLDDMLEHGERGLAIAEWLAESMPRERIVLVTGNVEPAAVERLAASGLTVFRKPLAAAVLAQWLGAIARSTATATRADAPAE